jgi:hypothetical protein
LEKGNLFQAIRRLSVFPAMHRFRTQSVPETFNFFVAGLIKPKYLHKIYPILEHLAISRSRNSLIVEPVKKEFMTVTCKFWASGPK